ncbi:MULTISPECIES: phosphoribosylamine--glycine ligase [unclassified Thermosipho (in: thermotogales)]|uniref:phosphoribosylamine--glycine ligase n=1 Tax=unclassified Thermosipho (in: thermotogales) TaxID=2676525 RepID=UPI000985972C|nr:MULTISPECIES: phosphoribosylamine--glycine ligase [unclassified Thermosipho (in: thermotogales)]MBT1247135.1 phosphoribosylamine--glycine ligase [Thermosipho sp. 1244]OOC47112.1 phosphoribosylamine--glycine ligase [Thermosipho sp. 1223]
MEICILGSGGREHAIGYSFEKIGFEVFYAPGNGLTGNNIDDIENFNGLIIPGSEEYLAKGVAEKLKNVFGPTIQGAKLESSKIFAKKFMSKYNLPTPRFEIVENELELREKIRKFYPPYVLKADGLAKGKGVLITSDESEAIALGAKLIKGQLIKGVSGPIILDEFIPGRELSAMAVVNEKGFSLYPFIQDYKRANTGNMGPNTGGMGSFGPISIDKSIKEKVEILFEKTLYGLKKEGINYRGFLYLGLMLFEKTPYILEYNVRLGDPETEVIVATNPENFAETILKATECEKIPDFSPENVALDVVLASKGYPISYKKGLEIKNITKIKGENFIIFGAGVKRNGEKLYTDGGRVLHCVGIGKTKEDAKNVAYDLAKKIDFEGKFFRTDIGVIYA